MKHRKLTTSLAAWFRENARDLPWRRTCDPYGIWVSEIMLQQTQVKTVIPYWERWMRELPSIASLARAKSEKIHKLWEGLGYYHRVRNMQRAAQVIVREHGGRFPTEFEAVLELPGIGRYTAGAICSIAFGQPRPILDGNVVRVLTRIFGIPGDPREKETNAGLWQLAQDLVQEAVGGLEPGKVPFPSPALAPHAASQFNQALMELGALICTPREPRCPICPLAKGCVAFRDGRVAELPTKGKRKIPTQRRFLAFVLRRGNQFLIRQRSAGEVNAHLWEFPNIEVELENRDIRAAAKRLLGYSPEALHAFLSVKHTITRYRITLDVFTARTRPRERLRFDGGRWVSEDALEQLAFASAHKRIVQRLGRH